MEIIAIVIVTLMTLGSQLLLKKAVSVLGPLMQTDKVAFLFAAIQSPYVLSAIAMQGFGFVLWMFVLSRIKLGVAFALSGAFFYFLIAISSWYFYGERLSYQQWIGLFLISAGVIVMNISK